MPDPDFELYDNVGRDADQIAAARYGIATDRDLLRWAKRDAEPFLGEHPLPAAPLPGPDLAPYHDALAAAETPAQASAVTQHLLDAAEPVLQAVSDYLLAAARWRRQNRGAEPESPPKMLMAAASRSLDVLALAHTADLAILRAAYDPSPAPKPQANAPASTAPALPPAPPKAPPGPAPSR
ncbi:hypothetical protein GCM10010211_19940 [Streptomyces albospinus]|uniref:Uncharacterized protein n=1 Tax=Streptomyces albospinus TaxID=285515 RepID=A0ABQ2UUX4_9ACTN|nr:hypothetical protein [Streptomyces albospinus]GGU55264.1 hypothetical protein GCM10010211_19940 [Streptomyces albospinus]